MRRSFTLFVVSLSAGSLFAVFMTLWHPLGLEERASPAARIRSARIPDEVLTLISDWIVKEL